MYWENLYNKKNKVNKPVELDYFQQEKVKEYRQLADDANRWLDLPTVPSRLSYRAFCTRSRMSGTCRQPSA